jgi:uncharacterized protein (TIGR02001 family)
MKKYSICFATIAILSSCAAFANDNDLFAGNFGLTSNYVYNGISQTFGSPAVQGGLDYSKDRGIYLGVWGSNISSNQYTNAGTEFDVYGGINYKVDENFAYHVGMLRIVYPDGKITAGVPPVQVGTWDTTQATFGFNIYDLAIKVDYSISDWYGINNSGRSPVMWVGNTPAANGSNADLGSAGSTYVSANYTFNLSETWSLLVHAGHQTVNNFSALDYTDSKLSINKSYKNANFSLAFTTTNATDNSLYHIKTNNEDKVLSDSAFTGSVVFTF